MPLTTIRAWGLPPLTSTENVTCSPIAHPEFSTSRLYRKALSQKSSPILHGVISWSLPRSPQKAFTATASPREPRASNADNFVSKSTACHNVCVPAGHRADPQTDVSSMSASEAIEGCAGHD
eukprot:399677-Amphidinium_carterae.2